jgi:hypothetical protein
MGVKNIGTRILLLYALLLCTFTTCTCEEYELNHSNKMDGNFSVIIEIDEKNRNISAQIMQVPEGYEAVGIDKFVYNLENPMDGVSLDNWAIEDGSIKTCSYGKFFGDIGINQENESTAGVLSPITFTLNETFALDNFEMNEFNATFAAHLRFTDGNCTWCVWVSDGVSKANKNSIAHVITVEENELINGHLIMNLSFADAFAGALPDEEKTISYGGPIMLATGHVAKMVLGTVAGEGTFAGCTDSGHGCHGSKGKKSDYPETESDGCSSHVNETELEAGVSRIADLENITTIKTSTPKRNAFSNGLGWAYSKTIKVPSDWIYGKLSQAGKSTGMASLSNGCYGSCHDPVTGLAYPVAGSSQSGHPGGGGSGKSNHGNQDCPPHDHTVIIDWGDNTQETIIHGTETELRPEHTYDTGVDGSYIVNITITGEFGRTGTDTIEVEVRKGPSS